MVKYTVVGSSTTDKESAGNYTAIEFKAELMTELELRKYVKQKFRTNIKRYNTDK